MEQIILHFANLKADKVEIRQQTLTDSKFGKYLLYAIGEIILVVVCILIDLQINIWNKNKITIFKPAVL